MFYLVIYIILYLYLLLKLPVLQIPYELLPPPPPPHNLVPRVPSLPPSRTLATSGHVTLRTVPTLGGAYEYRDIFVRFKNMQRKQNCTVPQMIPARKWSLGWKLFLNWTTNNPRTENDPRIGPQMILGREMIPNRLTINIEYNGLKFGQWV